MIADENLNFDLAVQIFIYDAESGILKWRKGRGNKSGAGAIAGSINSGGHLCLKFKGKGYLVHRIAWLIHFGQWPEHQVDHVNRIKTDNRIINLRAATSTENKRNTGLRRDNTSGCKGVCWHKDKGKWFAIVRINNKQKHLGYYDDIELADLVAKEARSKFYGDFAP